MAFWCVLQALWGTRRRAPGLNSVAAAAGLSGPGPQINNVGVSYEHAAYLTEIDDALIERLINVNVRALTKMTRMVLPGMVRTARAPFVRGHCPGA